LEWLAFAESGDALGDAGRAARLRLEGAARFPRSVSAALAAACAAKGLGRLKLAASLMLSGIELRHEAASARQELAALRADLADVGGAAQLWVELAELHPSRVAPRLRLGELLAANGRTDEAIAILDAAAAAFPDDEAVFEARGRRGETATARADFARSLELKPRNPRLWERLRALQPDDPFTASRSLVVVDVQGRARIEGTTRVTGQGAEGWRRHYGSTADRAARFEQACSSSYPGARVRRRGPRRPRAARRGPLHAGRPRPDAPRGGRPIAPPVRGPSRYVETLAPLSSRRHTLDLGSGLPNDFANEKAIRASSGGGRAARGGARGALRRLVPRGHSP